MLIPVQEFLTKQNGYLSFTIRSYLWIWVLHWQYLFDSFTKSHYICG